MDFQEMEILQESREFKAAEQLENAVNTFSWNPKKFAESIPFCHRTLQQTIFRTIVAVIQKMADDNYGVDDRNRAAHETAKRIVESGALDNAYLPFI